jgi:formate dehydrogenase iron-sulfur subunit
VEACPSQALIYGERQELLYIAHQRIDASPHEYISKVYGEVDAGGTSVLYISDVPLDFLRVQGTSTVPDDLPFPELSKGWMDQVPLVSLSTASLMTGLFYIIGRRMQAEEARNKRAMQQGK